MTPVSPGQAREIALLCFANHRNALWSLADQVEALTKERDALALGVDQWRVDFHELSLEHDALKAAAKLALDALDAFAEWEDMGDPQRPATEAIAALRQAGVQ